MGLCDKPSLPAVCTGTCTEIKIIMNAENMLGRCCCVLPLESHQFKPGGANDFLCKSCGRPRALHQLSDFITVSTGHTVSMDPKAAYRGSGAKAVMRLGI